MVVLKLIPPESLGQAEYQSMLVTRRCEVACPSLFHNSSFHIPGPRKPVEPSWWSAVPSSLWPS